MPGFCPDMAKTGEIEAKPCLESAPQQLQRVSSIETQQTALQTVHFSAAC